MAVLPEGTRTLQRGFPPGILSIETACVLRKETMEAGVIVPGWSAVWSWREGGISLGEVLAEMYGRSAGWYHSGGEAVGIESMFIHGTIYSKKGLQARRLWWEGGRTRWRDPILVRGLTAFDARRRRFILPSALAGRRVAHD